MFWYVYFDKQVSKANPSFIQSTHPDKLVLLSLPGIHAPLHAVQGVLVGPTGSSVWIPFPRNISYLLPWFPVRIVSLKSFDHHERLKLGWRIEKLSCQTFPKIFNGDWFEMKFIAGPFRLNEKNNGRQFRMTSCLVNIRLYKVSTISCFTKMLEWEIMKVLAKESWGLNSFWKWLFVSQKLISVSEFKKSYVMTCQPEWTISIWHFQIFNQGTKCKSVFETDPDITRQSNELIITNRLIRLMKYQDIN